MFPSQTDISPSPLYMHHKFHCEQIIIHQRSEKREYNHNLHSQRKQKHSTRPTKPTLPSPVYVSSYSYNILPKNKTKIPIQHNKQISLKESGARRIHERRSEWREVAHTVFCTGKHKSVEGGRNPRSPWISLSLSL